MLRALKKAGLAHRETQTPTNFRATNKKSGALARRRAGIHPAIFRGAVRRRGGNLAQLQKLLGQIPGCGTKPLTRRLWHDSSGGSKPRACYNLKLPNEQKDANTKVGFVSLGMPERTRGQRGDDGAFFARRYELTHRTRGGGDPRGEYVQLHRIGAKRVRDTILEMAEHKKFGAAKKLIVAGCLVERYESNSGASAGVDAVVGTGEVERIIEAVEGDLKVLPAARPRFVPRFDAANCETPKLPPTSDCGGVRITRAASAYSALRGKFVAAV